jgi:hypothetical protein
VSECVCVCVCCVCVCVWYRLKTDECMGRAGAMANGICCTLCLSVGAMVGHRHLYPNILRIEKMVTFNTAKGIFGFTESYDRRSCSYALDTPCSRTHAHLWMRTRARGLVPVSPSLCAVSAQRCDWQGLLSGDSSGPFFF